MAVQSVKVIPLEVVLRNIATGSLCKQAPIAQGSSLRTGLAWISITRTMTFGDPLLTEARLGTAALW